MLVDIFVGRFQPLHNGHMKVLSQMENPMILLVKGSKSVEDTDKNPLSEEEQIRLIHLAHPRAIVRVVKHGYLPDLIRDIEAGEHEIGIARVFAGKDRAHEYKKQFNREVAKGNTFDTDIVVVERSSDDVSATKVRVSIRENDEETFQSLVPEALWGEFTALQRSMT